MGEKPYSVEFEGWPGEGFTYIEDGEELWLSTTRINGNRLYCRDTSGDLAPALEFEKRRHIFLNLCDYFKSHQDPLVFMLDIRDKDRLPLEALFAELATEGHKVSVEYDSAENRERREDETYLHYLANGSKMVVGDIEIRTPEEYCRWKASRKEKPTSIRIESLNPLPSQKVAKYCGVERRHKKQ